MQLNFTRFAGLAFSLTFCIAHIFTELSKKGKWKWCRFNVHKKNVIKHVPSVYFQDKKGVRNQINASIGVCCL